MRADSSVLIYIIISVVLLVVSSFNKHKKKMMSSDAPETDRPDMPPSENPWEKEIQEIFGEVLGEKPEVVRNIEPQPQPVITPVAVKREAAQPKQTQEQPQKVADPSKNSPLSPVFVSQEEELRDIEFKDVDLERAVIYSEILNRKYF